MTADRTLSSGFKVGFRYHCHVTASLAEIAAADGSAPMALKMRWSPRVPERLSANEQADYLRGRNAFIAELASALNWSIAVLDGDGEITTMRPSVQPAGLPN